MKFNTLFFVLAAALMVLIISACQSSESASGDDDDNNDDNDNKTDCVEKDCIAYCKHKGFEKGVCLMGQCKCANDSQTDDDAGSGGGGADASDDDDNDDDIIQPDDDDDNDDDIIQPDDDDDNDDVIQPDDDDDDVCKPNCGGKECGDDGCGGTCGKGCASGDICSQGACLKKCTTDSNCDILEECKSVAGSDKACVIRKSCTKASDCASGSHCVTLDIGGICLLGCDPTAAKNACYTSDSSCLPVAKDAFVCLPTSGIKKGQPCSFLNDCETGSVCVIDSCISVCNPTAPDCGRGYTCFDGGMGKNWGYCWQDGNIGECDYSATECDEGNGYCMQLGEEGACYPDCDVLKQNCEAQDASCIYMDFNEEQQYCIPRFGSDKGEGESCEYANECKRGLQCIQLEAEAKCYKFCDYSSPTQCRSDQQCTLLVGNTGLCELKEDSTGATKKWYAHNFSNNSQYQIETTLIKQSLYGRLYLEKGESMSDRRAGQILDIFDNNIYPNIHKYFGSENIPGLDGVNQINLIFTRVPDDGVIEGGGIGGYFDPTNAYSDADTMRWWGIHSNEAEIIYMNTKYGIESDDTLSTVAHEFQHLVHNAEKEGQNSTNHLFIDEGMAQLAEDYCGWLHSAIMPIFLNTGYKVSLSEWSLTYEDYAVAYAFARYIADQYDRGGELTREIVGNEYVGPICYDKSLQRINSLKFDEVFIDWAIANVVNAKGDVSKYGYKTYDLKDSKLGLYGIKATATNKTGTLNQLPPRSFNVYYYSAASGTVAWGGAASTAGAALVYGAADGTQAITRSLGANSTNYFKNYAYLIVYNLSDTKSASAGSVQYSGTGKSRHAFPPPVEYRYEPPKAVSGTPWLYRERGLR